MLEGEALERSPTFLNVCVEVTNIKAPRAGDATVLDEQQQTLLDKIAQLPLADP